jgi:hypothetical protein
VSGECDLELDSGEIVHMKPGDIVVQRGKNSDLKSLFARVANEFHVPIQSVGLDLSAPRTA